MPSCDSRWLDRGEVGGIHTRPAFDSCLTGRKGRLEGGAGFFVGYPDAEEARAAERYAQVCCNMWVQFKEREESWGIVFDREHALIPSQNPLDGWKIIIDERESSASENTI